MRTLSWILVTALAGACAASGCASEDGSAPQTPLSAPSETGVAEVRLRRLTAREYDHTVFDLLGDDQVFSVMALPADLPTPFDNDYTVQQPSRALVDAAETLARDITLRLLADPPRRDAVLGCTPTGATDTGCLQSLVRALGRHALRRPLTDEEVADYVTLGSTYAEQEDDFYAGVEVVVRAILQDIQFLYRVEVGAAVAEHPGVFRLNGYEVATRLAYLIWGTTPSKELLDRAEQGELDTQDGVVDAAVAMLADDKARRQLDRFHAMWLGYDTLPHAPELTASMRNETRALIDRVVFDKQLSWTEIFTSSETYVDDTLAAHYGLASPGGQAWMDYSADGRRGILSHGSFLSVAHDVGETSLIRRGLHVLRRLSCQDIPPPPPGVDTEVPTDGECRLDNLVGHAEASCAGCHRQVDPIGLGLEQYDVAGRFRTFEKDKPQCGIDGEGELMGVGAFNGPAELGERLVESGRLEGCAVQHVVQYAIGRELVDADDALVEHLTAQFAESGRFDQLVVALVSDESFFFRREGAE